MNRAIGGTVRKRREAGQLNIIEAARVIDVSVADYEACELGHKPFQAEHLFKLAKVFGCKARDLMPNEDKLSKMDYDVRYGDAEEVRDLIFYFSGVVSPTLREFFLKQIEEASVQGERLGDPEPVAAQIATPKKKRSRPFRFLWAN